ncbi:pentatricopeptide repeat-containing protein At2g03380, mitochondrial [Primulina eburnea]|uniref:pentatricopeptide repeat-containing protein At2g03380, mitochondrial n=1 Tax=Primulina eburnea TaxID=1245227 RepID=UPI003C6C7961
MKLLSFLHRNTRRLALSESHPHFTTFAPEPTHNLELHPSLSSIQSFSKNPFFCLLNICRSLSSLRKIQALLVVSGEADDPLLKTKLLGLYGLFGHVENARHLFDQIPDPDFVSCKTMMRWYFINDLYGEIIAFYRFIRRRFLVVDDIVFSIVLKACRELRDSSEGRQLHGYIIQMGSTDSFVLTGLVDMYAKCGRIDIACKVFERIWNRNVVCWTSMIVGYVQNDCAREGLLLFNRMRNHLVEGNSYTLDSVVRACAKLGALHQGKWVHGFVIKNCIELSSCLVTSLLDMYVKCGAIIDARLIFDECSTVDLVAWTAMIVGYAQSGYAHEALVLFTNKKWLGISPNSITLASVLSACAQSGNFKLGSSVHGLGIKAGMDDANVMNALADMYAKCFRMQEAVYLFDSMVDKDVISWNSIIGGYSKTSHSYEALRLFKRMRSTIFQPDPVTMVAVLSTCASLGDIRFGSSLHAYTIKQGFLSSSSVYVGTALLDLYAKSGDAKSAQIVFDEMTNKNTVTWGAMIGGYGKQGDVSKCIELFGDLTKHLEPTGAIFTAMLSACSHSGMIREGWRCFDSMCRVYNFTPSMEHYVSIVDLLARSGRLEEALEFIEKMPVQPDITVFGAFLHGCSVHSRFDLGDMAVKNMLKMHPHDAPRYVLLSNLYASKGRWSEASQLRDSMKKRGLRKSPGSSQVGLHLINELYSPNMASYG